MIVLENLHCVICFKLLKEVFFFEFLSYLTLITYIYKVSTRWFIRQSFFDSKWVTPEV